MPSRKKTSKARSTAKAKASRKKALVCDCHLFGVEATALAMTASNIDDLELLDYAADAARALLTKHPNVVFTSGRRNSQQQADAMAGNVVQNRNWIAGTYKASPERDQLQGWVDGHPEATKKADISAGLLGVMDDWTDDQKANLSRHFSGQAFDVRPIPGGDDVKATMKALPNLHQFFDKEGGLTIWHADFEKS